MQKQFRSYKLKVQACNKEYKLTAQIVNVKGVISHVWVTFADVVFPLLTTHAFI